MTRVALSSMLATIGDMAGGSEMERQAGVERRTSVDPAHDTSIWLAGAFVVIAAAICLALGSWLGAEWVESTKAWYVPGLDDSECWACGRGFAGEYIALWLGCVLVTLVPGAIIGHSRSPHRRAGLAVLIVAVASAALVGFGLSTGIGGRLGFPVYNVPFGIGAVSLSSAIGSGFGYEVGSLIRRRGAGQWLPAGEVLAVILLGVVVLGAGAFWLLAIIDALLFG